MDDFHIVSIDELHDLIAPALESSLQPLGFQCQKPLHWVRADDAPVRQLFCFHQWKGGQMAPAWGLSLDFVPHVSGGSIKWHRTSKSARFDLTVDARNRELDLPYRKGSDPISQEAARVVREAVKSASEFWDRGRSIAELPALFESLKSELQKGFYSYTQHSIAYALTLAATGQGDAARVELEKFLARPGLPDATRSKLANLLQTQLESAVT